MVKIAKFVNTTRVPIKQKRIKRIGMFMLFNEISFTFEFKI